MLLGDLIAGLDDDAVAAETLINLGDLTLLKRTSDAAADAGLDVGAFVGASVRRYLNQAPPDEWTTLAGLMAHSDDPGSVILRRALTFGTGHETPGAGTAGRMRALPYGEGPE